MFQIHKPSGSGEEDFKSFFGGIYRHGGQLGHVTWTVYRVFRSPFLGMLLMKFGFDWLGGFRGKNPFEIVNDGRTTTTGD